MNISSAEIIDQISTKDTENIVMNYIHGISGEEYAIYGDYTIAKMLSDGIENIISREIESSIETFISKDIFINKLNEIENGIFDPTIKKLGSKIRSDIVHYSDRLLIPIGICHGDLTLSNIIYSNYLGIKLIDFLGVYLETPLQDVAKVVQEYFYGWSFRYLPNALKIKGEILLTSNIPKVIKNLEIKYEKPTHLITRVALYRIAPYLKDNLTRDWLIQSLGHYIEVTN